MKRIITLLLATCMLFCLSACSSTEINSNVNTQLQTQSDNAQSAYESALSSDTVNSEAPSVNTDTEENNTVQSQPVISNTNTNNGAKSTHTHSYSVATCTSPKKCACGATAGTALGHQFSDATCTSPKICTRCGITSGSALGHSYSAATCTEPQKCSRCGATTGSALGHNYVNNKCTRCEKVDPDSLPIGLDKLYIIDSSSNYKYDSNSFQDTYGNTYIGVHLFGYNSSSESYAIYNLNQKYNNFTGTIFSSPKLYSDVYIDYYIYVDDVLAYSQTKLERTSNKIDFSINVKNATKLTIKVKTYLKPNIVGGGYLGLGSIANAQLTK